MGFKGAGYTRGNTGTGITQVAVRAQLQQGQAPQPQQAQQVQGQQAGNAVSGSTNTSDSNTQEQFQGEGTQAQSIPVVQPPSLPVPLPPPMPAPMVPTAPATQAQSLVNSKTKTALANMLSNRLNGGGGQHHTSSTTATTTTTTQLLAPEGSAAGQLRRMTAQHHAAQQQQQQQQQQQAAQMSPQQLLLFQQQQRRTLSNITNNATGVAVAGAPGGVTSVRVPGVPGQVAVVGQPGVPPGHCGALTPQQIQAAKQARAGQMVAKTGIPQQHPEPVEYYGHHPNAKIPPEMCLLGCIFFIVEYDEEVGNQLNNWRKIIRDYGGEEDPVYGPRVTHVLCETQTNPRVKQAMHDGKRLVTAQWLNDVIVKQQMVPPWHALHLPVQFGETKPCRNMIIAYSGFEGEERARIKIMIELVGAKCTSYLSQQNNLLVCRKQEGAKYRQAREWGKPVVNAHWLFEVMFCSYNCICRPEQRRFQHFNLMNPFCINCDAVPHLMGPWTNPVLVTQEAYEKAKITASPRRKKPKLDKSPDWSQENMKQEEMDTSCSGLSDNKEGAPVVLLSSVSDSFGLQQKIRELGGSVTKVCREATHLVMSKPQRTVKFFCSISFVQHILSESWVLDSYSKDKFQDERDYILEDPEFEASHSFKFSELLAKPNRNQLFKNKIFYITPGVIPSQACLREMIEHAGGSVDRQRRTLKEILDLNAGVNHTNHFSNPLSSIHSSMPGIPFPPPISNIYTSPQTSVTLSQLSLTNGPTMAPTVSNHTGMSSATADSEPVNKPSSNPPPQNNIATNLPAMPTPNGLNKDEAMEVDSESKRDIKQDAMDSDGKKDNSLEMKQDTKKSDDAAESEERVLMKPPIPVTMYGPKDFRPRAPERPNSDKKEPVYLVISVLNDLHLVKDLMKAKLGVYSAEFVMSSILHQKIDFDSAIHEDSHPR